MCQWGTSTVLRLWIPAELSHTGEGRYADKGVDTCIAPIVKALNDAGAVTVASCCGHGHRPGNITLGDGRELIIAPDFETGRRIDALFPKTITGEERPAPFCRDCKFYGQAVFGLDYCHGSPVNDLVTGHRGMNDPKQARADEAKCGERGAWFVQRPAPPRPRLGFWRRLLGRFKRQPRRSWSGGYPPLPEPLPPPPAAPPPPPNRMVQR